MDAKIDYLSFTCMTDVRHVEGQGEQRNAVMAALWGKHPVFMEWASTLSGWENGGARAHYALSEFNARTFCAVRFGGSANHILVELPGTACQSLRDADLLTALITEVSERLTRLDVAVDIPHGCSPAEFVRAGYNERFKSHAELVSESGETEYVGSMKSERFARIYRYSAPHPRANTLRVEFVLRSDFAKAAAAHLLEASLVSLAALLGNTFGWVSEEWQPETTTEGRLRATRADRHEPGRVRWLYNVVIPAIIKASKEGLIDLPEFLGRIDAVYSVD